jgi:hypothetical protein
LKKNPPHPNPPKPTRKNGRLLHSMTQLLIGYMENLFLKLACHYFWPGLIALLKNTLPVEEERRRRRRRQAKKKRIQVRQHRLENMEKIHLFYSFLSPC